jgi:hypothetical protein
VVFPVRGVATDASDARSRLHEHKLTGLRVAAAV